TTLDPDLPLGDNKKRDSDTAFRVLADHYVNRVMHELRLPHELLPADGHDQALSRALAFATARLGAVGRAVGEAAASPLPGEQRVAR
ncbi:MAG: hypothetical protein LC808_10500, partial [Actinobacteria bacterium]|nr:hypothetical protein [Actinomycetota bacterium]